MIKVAFKREFSVKVNLLTHHLSLIKKHHSNQNQLYVNDTMCLHSKRSKSQDENESCEIKSWIFPSQFLVKHKHYKKTQIKQKSQEQSTLFTHSLVKIAVFP